VGVLTDLDQCTAENVNVAKLITCVDPAASNLFSEARTKTRPGPGDSIMNDLMFGSFYLKNYLRIVSRYWFAVF